jgi:hypothetical protein
VILKDSNSDRISNALKTNRVAGLDWIHPLEMITSALVLMGASSFFRSLPIPNEYAYLLVIIVLIAWRYGVHRAGILRWRWGGSLSYSFFSLKQGLLNGIGFFVFMMAVFTWNGSRPTLRDAALAAVGGLVYGLLGVNSQASLSSPRPQRANS